MKVKNLINLSLIIILLLGIGCDTENKENITEFKLESPWDYDSVTNASVLFPMEKEFDFIVQKHLKLFNNKGIPDFMYNVFLDTIYKNNDIDDRTLSVRAAIISQISDRQMLETMLKNDSLNQVWSEAKRDSTRLRTNIDMIKSRLSALDKSVGNR
jgi:hypothetical protein